MLEKNGNKNTYIIKVGTEDRPATEADLKDVANMIRFAKDQDVKNIVTHHAIEVVELEGNSEIKIDYHKDPNQLSLF